MKAVTIALYDIDELPEAVRERVIEKQHDINVDYRWWDYTYEFFVDLCRLLGVTVDPKHICFRGFCCQGEGSSFLASMDTVALIKAVAEQAWKTEFPSVELTLSPCPVDRRVLDLIRRDWITVRSLIAYRNRETSVRLSFGADINNDSDGSYRRLNEQLDLLESWLEAAALELNHCLFESLREEYEYLTGKEAVLDSIRASDYCFTLDGKLANRLDRLATTYSVSERVRFSGLSFVRLLQTIADRMLSRIQAARRTWAKAR